MRIKNGNTHTAGPSTLVVFRSSWLRWWGCWLLTSTLRRIRSCGAGHALTSLRAQRMLCCACLVIASVAAPHGPAHALPNHQEAHVTPHLLLLAHQGAKALACPPQHCSHKALSPFPPCRIHTHIPAHTQPYPEVISHSTPCPETPNWVHWELWVHLLYMAQWIVPHYTSCTTAFPKRAAGEEQPWWWAAHCPLSSPTIQQECKIRPVETRHPHHNPHHSPPLQWRGKEVWARSTGLPSPRAIPTRWTGKPHRCSKRSEQKRLWVLYSGSGMKEVYQIRKGKKEENLFIPSVSLSEMIFCFILWKMSFRQKNYPVTIHNNNYNIHLVL